MSSNQAEHRAEGECQGVKFYVSSGWMFYVPEIGREFKDYNSMSDAINAKKKCIESSRREFVVWP